MSDFVIENGILKAYNGSEEIVYVPDGVSVIGGLLSDADKNNDALRGDAIGYKAFYGNNTVREVHLPDSVSAIEFKAFEHCGNLELLSFSSSLRSFGCNCLVGCTSLRTIEYRGTMFEFCSVDFSSQALNLDKAVCSDGTINFRNEYYIETLNFPGTREEWDNMRENVWLKHRVRNAVCTDD